MLVVWATLTCAFTSSVATALAARRSAPPAAGTSFSIELRRSGDSTEAIKGVARKVFDRVK
jgi:hypothetical protein